MLQNPCKTLEFKKNMVYKIPPGGEVNHIQPVAYEYVSARTPNICQFVSILGILGLCGIGVLLNRRTSRMG